MRTTRLLAAVPVSLVWLLAFLAGTPAVAQQGGAPPLAHLQFDIVGVRLVVDPPALTVPKNIATQINTSLVTPPGLGAEVRERAARGDHAALHFAERNRSTPGSRHRVDPDLEVRGTQERPIGAVLEVIWYPPGYP